MSVVRGQGSTWVKNEADDEWETENINLVEMIDLLNTPKDGLHIWEPFVSSGHSADFMRATGATVTETDTDFFETDPPAGAQIVISNPPFSSKRYVLRRLCELDIPFILIVPVTTICYEYTHRLVQEYGGFQVTIPPTQPYFTKSGERRGRPPFYSVYLSRNINPIPSPWLTRDDD